MGHALARVTRSGSTGQTSTEEAGHGAGGALRLLLPVDPSSGAAPGVRADRRPARRAVRGARRVRQRLAALAQGLPARGPAGLGPPPRLAARAAPAQRAHL